MKVTFEDLSATRFTELSEERQAAVDAAPDTPLPKIYPVNALAQQMHPVRQYLKIEKIFDLPDNTKTYRLVPDPERGTTRLAGFAPGKYLNVFLDIEGMPVNRPYSISSSPKDAKDGHYDLTIKYVQDGLVSRYILDKWKEGDAVEVSDPNGQFTYMPLRDAKTVVGVAGGSGITPFLSMARAIVEGSQDFNLILLYGSRAEDVILFRDEFERLEKASNGKVKVVHVLSDEEKHGFEHGFITADLIRKYAPESGEYSVFLCGPQQMYNFVDKELESLNLRRKFIRHELFGEVHDPAKLEGYPGCPLDTVKITVTVRDQSKTVTGSVNDTIMQTLEKNGIAVPSRCRSGLCGFCHSLLTSGQVYVPKNVDGRRLADYKFGYVHPCVTFPLSDIEIVVSHVK